MSVYMFQLDDDNVIYQKWASRRLSEGQGHFQIGMKSF